MDVTAEHFTIVEKAQEGDKVAFKYGAACIDKEITNELKDEALVREFERNVQLMRKELGLTRVDSIELNYETVGELARILPMNMKRVKKSIKASRIGTKLDQTALAKQFDIEGEIVKISVKKI